MTLINALKSEKAKEISLYLLYFISFYSSTCFFFDHRLIHILGHPIHFPIGLLFFPFTFVFSNLVQDNYGKRTATTLIYVAFLADGLLVAMGVLMAYLGDRGDYWTVFKDLPTILVATFIFLIISGQTNIIIYGLFKKKYNQSMFYIVCCFFLTITISELLVSSLSMPLLFIKEGLNTNIILSILAIVFYKIAFNFIVTLFYFIYQMTSKSVSPPSIVKS